MGVGALGSPPPPLPRPQSPRPPTPPLDLEGLFLWPACACARRAFVFCAGCVQVVCIAGILRFAIAPGARCAGSEFRAAVALISVLKIYVSLVWLVVVVRPAPATTQPQPPRHRPTHARPPTHDHHDHPSAPRPQPRLNHQHATPRPRGAKLGPTRNHTQITKEKDTKETKEARHTTGHPNPTTPKRQNANANVVAMLPMLCENMREHVDKILRF